ncbi:hypothetical protein evm_004820 [Chilo suppressalis]|nr:hypothetical protein evm_004820 [Chilo suppressalis]
MKLVKDLIKELDRQIIEYGNTYDPDDQVEWTVVVDEVKAFIHAEPVVAVIDHENYSVIISNRITPLTTPAIEKTPQMNLTLQEVLIVGSSSQQVKFSELTMDMFRMLQTLEKEPTGEVQHNFDESPRARYTSTPNAHGQDGIDPNAKMPNPHKYLLFKPSPSQILVYLASGCNDLPPNGVLLLYISADGHIPQPQKHAEDGMGVFKITMRDNDARFGCAHPMRRCRYWIPMSPTFCQRYHSNNATNLSVLVEMSLAVNKNVKMLWINCSSNFCQRHRSLWHCCTVVTLAKTRWHRHPCRIGCAHPNLASCLRSKPTL